MNYLSVQVITPEHSTYSHSSVVSITLPTIDGEITILPGHQPLITTIGIGELRVVESDKKEKIFFVNNGALHINELGEVSILVDESENIETIALDLAEEAYERARLLKEQATDAGESEYARFEALIERELGRVSIARKYRK